MKRLVSIPVCGFQGQDIKTRSVLDTCPEYFQIKLLSWNHMKETSNMQVNVLLLRVKQLG